MSWIVFQIHRFEKQYKFVLLSYSFSPSREICHRGMAETATAWDEMGCLVLLLFTRGWENYLCYKQFLSFSVWNHFSVLVFLGINSDNFPHGPLLHLLSFLLKPIIAGHGPHVYANNLLQHLVSDPPRTLLRITPPSSDLDQCFLDLQIKTPSLWLEECEQ